MIKSRYDIPLEETMAFETVYPKELQLDLSQKKEILDATGSIFAWLWMGNLPGRPMASRFTALMSFRNA